MALGGQAAIPEESPGTVIGENVLETLILWNDHQDQQQLWSGASQSLENKLSAVEGRAGEVTQTPWRSLEDHE